MNGIIDEPQDCLICGTHCKNRKSLAMHLSKRHKEYNTEKYTLKFKLNDVPLLCKCGCGKETNWSGAKARFNQYVTGHNSAGFVTTPVVFTEEQIQRRNEQIRKAYTENREQIIKKISSSVKEGLKNTNIDFSNYFHNKWKDEEFRKNQHTSRILSWSGVEGEDRKKRVFTKEFGYKISLANLKRDVKKTSKQEQEFVEHLISMNFEIQTNVWKVYSDKVSCFDLLVLSTNTYVEFDGVYWHGLDRTHTYTYDQVSNMINDLKKNQNIIDNKQSLLRIRSDADYRTIMSFDDLVKQSYLYIKEGIVVKQPQIDITSIKEQYIKETNQQVKLKIQTFLETYNKF